MYYSKLFGKTTKTAPRGAKLASHKLLYRGGFIRQSAAGYYYFLPLGWRVHQKIEELIRQEMNQAGAQEMLSPTLHPIELWQETNRTSSAAFELMTVKSRTGAKFALGGTAEEMFVDLVRRLNLSYRDLPFNVYQFSTKFRDELRSRGGLLRVREFIMKDAYSFDQSHEEFEKEYQKMKQVYQTIFAKLDLTTLVAEADSGYIGGDYCHEFIYPTPVGEDEVFVCGGCGYQANKEKAEFVRENKNPNEEIKPFEIIDQPEWVETMNDNIKHYGQPLWRYLKNVVYKDDQGRLIIASLRGDQEVNETKLKRVLGVDSLIPAEDKDLESLGTRHGWVHSWDHEEVVYVGDLGLKSVKNFIGGYKEKTTDSANVNYGRDFKYQILADIVSAHEGATCPRCRKGQLKRQIGIEVGHIFQLGHHYTKLMSGANFVDENGKDKPFYMGCYGIGLGRTMATVVEAHHDEEGIIWPRAIAPFQAHLVALGKNQTKAEKIYQKLTAEGLEVLYDDRDKVLAGAKFADADLIGIPIRLVISDKTEDKIEWKERDRKKTELLQYDEVVERLAKIFGLPGE
ncbi:MAG: proline--tRNA ligase [Candidatus Shapirobacteria bacterium]|nr:proline--tRNA ligase [Candidatus Shapirobacteria bacterium]